MSPTSYLLVMGRCRHLDLVSSDGTVNDSAYQNPADLPLIKSLMHYQPTAFDYNSIPPNPVDVFGESHFSSWASVQPASWIIESFPPQEKASPQLTQNVVYPLPAAQDAKEIKAGGDSHSNQPSPTVQIDQSPNGSNDGSQHATKSGPLSVHCAEPGCGRTFSDRACLLRHRREVHRISTRYKGPGTYPCPITKCPRHTKAFARLWNLKNHMKVHGQGAERFHEQLTISLSDHAKRRKLREEAELGEACSLGVQMSDSRPPQQSLQAKLECLLEERRELDEKIRALRNAQRIVEDMN